MGQDAVEELQGFCLNGILWKIVPQSIGRWEERVEVCVYSGRWNPYFFVVAPAGSAQKVWFD